ncbi:MAG: GatB/YqeY domain-containing protein [Rhodoblastus sp.]|nr:MAG: GatB/YqeY domain-containing protein [Rhodoblastus sp.]
MRQKFTEMMKAAMKAGDKPRLAAVRLIQAKLKDLDIEARGAGKTVGDEDILSMLQKMVKQRRDSIAMYQQGGRQDLVDAEQAEIDVINEFLPKGMDEAEIAAAIKAAVAETGAAGMKDMGKVVAALKAKYAGRMDFGKVSPAVKAALAG